MLSRALGLAAPIKLLLVGSDQDYAQRLIHVLQTLDTQYEVEIADGPAALERIEDRVHDLYLVDLGWPDCYGVDLVRASRSRVASFPFVMLAEVLPDMRDRQVLGTDCLAWIPKDAQPAHLDRTLKLALRKWLECQPQAVESTRRLVHQHA